jgi:DNA-binding NarL/FixJ family response regulator
VSGTIRLLIADDHPVVRDGLRGIFEATGEFEVAGEAANGREAVDRAAALRPDVILMDLRMPELDGVSAIRALAQRGVAARVLVLTTFDTDTDVLPAIEAGATGYLLKDSPPEELLRGVRAAARGEAVLSPSVATRLLGQVRQPAREPLSQRELDILGLIARGCSNREAAARLYISEATVKTHVLHIYAKLGVNDRAAAVATGFERGLLPRPLPAPALTRRCPGTGRGRRRKPAGPGCPGTRACRRPGTGRASPPDRTAGAWWSTRRAHARVPSAAGGRPPGHPAGAVRSTRARAQAAAPRFRSCYRAWRRRPR